MKKFFSFLFCLVVAGCSEQYQFPPEVRNDVIEENYQVIYSPASGVWSNGGMVDDRIVFTKHISSGSGSYSEYVSDKTTIYPGTTKEFLYQGRLIGYNQHDLKFAEVRYQEGKFVVEELTPAEVQKLFPGLDIVLTSQAVGGELKVSKFPFVKKTFMILNDTPESYYHYSFENFDNAGEPFKSVLTVTTPDEIIFSHFKSKDKLFPILKILIENGL